MTVESRGTMDHNIRNEMNTTTATLLFVVLWMICWQWTRAATCPAESNANTYDCLARVKVPRSIVTYLGEKDMNVTSPTGEVAVSNILLEYPGGVVYNTNTRVLYFTDAHHLKKVVYINGGNRGLVQRVASANSSDILGAITVLTDGSVLVAVDDGRILRYAESDLVDEYSVLPGGIIHGMAQNTSNPDDVYFTHSSTNEVYLLNLSNGFVSVFFGDGEQSNTESSIDSPKGIAFDKMGNMYVTANRRVRRFGVGGEVVDLYDPDDPSGSTSCSFVNFSDNKAHFCEANSIAIHPQSGELYVGDECTIVSYNQDTGIFSRLFGSYGNCQTLDGTYGNSPVAYVDRTYAMSFDRDGDTLFFSQPNAFTIQRLNLGCPYGFSGPNCLNKQRIGTKDVVIGSQCTFESRQTPNRYVRHSPDTVYVASEMERNTLFYPTVSYMVRPTLNGNNKAITLEPLSPTNYRFRHANYFYRIDPVIDETLYRNDASTFVIPGFDGNPDTVSLQAAAFDCYFANQVGDDRLELFIGSKKLYNLNGVETQAFNQLAGNRKGSLFTVGTIALGASFDSTPLTTTGSGSNILVSRVDDAGPVWHLVLAATTTSAGTSVVADNDFVYVGGAFIDPLIHPISIPVSGLNGLIIKLNATYGSLIWAKYVPYCDRIFVAKSDTSALYIGGYSTGAGTDFGGICGVISSSDRAFVAKLDPSTGDCIWVRSWGGHFMYDLAVNPVDDSVYATGYFDGQILVNGQQWTAGVHSGFFIQFKQDGSWGFTKKLVGSATDLGTRIAFDTTGNIFLAGYYVSNGLDLEGYSLYSPGYNALFLVSYNIDGSYRFHQTWYGTQSAEIFGMVVEGNNIILSGQYSGQIFGMTSVGDVDLFVIRVQDVSGAILQQNSFGGTNYEHVTDMARVDGRLYILGSYTTATNFYSPISTAAGKAGGFLAEVLTCVAPAGIRTSASFVPSCQRPCMGVTNYYPAPVNCPPGVISTQSLVSYFNGEEFVFPVSPKLPLAGAGVIRQDGRIGSYTSSFIRQATLSSLPTPPYSSLSIFVMLKCTPILESNTFRRVLLLKLLNGDLQLKVERLTTQSYLTLEIRMTEGEPLTSIYRLSTAQNMFQKWTAVVVTRTPSGVTASIDNGTIKPMSLSGDNSIGYNAIIANEGHQFGSPEDDTFVDEFGLFIPGLNETEIAQINTVVHEPYCYGKFASNPTVCSAHGSCTIISNAPACNCDTDYLGEQCNMWNCYEVVRNDTTNVCSGRGVCVSPDVCQCSEGSGENCEIMPEPTIQPQETSNTDSPEYSMQSSSYTYQEHSSAIMEPSPTQFSSVETQESSYTVEDSASLSSKNSFTPSDMFQISSDISAEQTNQFSQVDSLPVVLESSATSQLAGSSQDRIESSASSGESFDSNLPSLLRSAEEADSASPIDSEASSRTQMESSPEVSHYSSVPRLSTDGGSTTESILNSGSTELGASATLPTSHSGFPQISSDVPYYHSAPNVASSEQEIASPSIPTIHTCDGIPYNDRIVCNGFGTCLETGICECLESSGYTGSFCLNPVCYNIAATNSSVCGGKGVCDTPDRCICYPNYEGPECLLWKCGNHYRNEVNACNGGVCVAPNVCQSCPKGYSGLHCDPECNFGGNGSVSCSGHGNCLSPNLCACSPGYSGNLCQYPVCYNISASNSSQVCSGHGTCSAPNNCICRSGYTGLKCQIPVCFGISANATGQVCSGVGNCSSTDTCQCDSRYEGVACESQKDRPFIKLLNPVSTLPACADATMTAKLMSRNNETLEIEASYSWSLQASSMSEAGIANLTSYLLALNSSTVTVPRSLLKPGNTFTLLVTALDKQATRYTKFISFSKLDYVFSAKIDASESITMRRSQSNIIQTSAIVPTCASTSDLQFRWRIYFNQQEIKSVYTKHLVIPPRFFPHEGVYRLVFTAAFDRFSTESSITITVLEARPIVRIRGGDIAIGVNSTYSIDASQSADSEYPDEPKVFHWSCMSHSSVGCPSIAATNSAMLSFSSANAGNFTVLVTMTTFEGRNASSSVNIEVKAAKIPRVAIATVLPDIINANQKLSLSARVEPVEDLELIALQWSITERSTQKKLDLSGMLLSKSSTRRNLIIKEKVLEPGTEYIFTITARYTSNNITTYSSVSATTSQPPVPTSPFNFDIRPASGISMDTVFSLTAGNWTTSQEALPLTYSFEYLDQVSGTYRLLAPFDISNSLSTKFLAQRIPEITVALRIKNFFDDEFITYQTVTVQNKVFQPSEIKDLFSAKKQESAQGGSGVSDRDLGFTLIAVAQLISDAEGDTSSIVDDLLSFIDTGNNTEQTTQSAELTSQKLDAIETLTRKPQALTSDQKTKMASLLGSMLTTTSNTTSPVSQTITQSIVKSASSVISNLISGVSSSGGSQQQSREIAEQSTKALKQLSHFTLNSLEPGEDPSIIQTSTFTMSVQKNYPSDIQNTRIGSAGNTTASIQVPSSPNSVESDDTIISLEFLSYPDGNNILFEDKSQNLTSSIVSFRFLDSDGNKIKYETSEENPLVIVIDKTPMSNSTSSNFNYVCRFFDDTLSSDWGESGCKYFNETETTIICHCNHTTSFAAFIQYSAEDLAKPVKPVEKAVYYVGMIMNICYAIIIVVLLVFLTYHRKKQPIRSRSFAPFLCLLAILIETILQGVIRNSFLCCHRKVVAVNVVGNIVIIVSNPLAVVSLFVFFWQNLRYLMLRRIYSLMMKQSDKQVAITTRFIKFLTSKIAFLVVCATGYAAVFIYFLIFSVVGMAKHKSISSEEAMGITIATAVSYSIIMLVVGSGILITMLVDTLLIPLRQRSAGKKNKVSLANLSASDSEQTKKKPITVELVFSPVKNHFLNDDPLMFRVDSVLMLLALTAGFISFIIGIVKQYAKLRDDSGAMVAWLVTDLLFMALRIMAFGGFITALTIKNLIRSRSNPFANLQEEEAMEASQEATILETLRSKQGIQLIRAYCEKEFSLENLLIWQELNEVYKRGLDPTWMVMNTTTRLQFLDTLHEKFIATNSPCEVNIPAPVKKMFIAFMNSVGEAPMDEHARVLGKLYNSIMSNISDTFSRFVDTQEYKRYYHIAQMHQKLEVMNLENLDD